jgi:hypothetical protein
MIPCSYERVLYGEENRQELRRLYSLVQFCMEVSVWPMQQAIIDMFTWPEYLAGMEMPIKSV